MLRDAGGAAAAPQGEIQAVTAYDTSTGTFTTAAFTAAVAVGDEVVILHAAIAYAVAVTGSPLALVLAALGVTAGGIATYPAAADIGNGVSLAQALRAILTSLAGGDDYDAYGTGGKMNNTTVASIKALWNVLATLFAADGVNVFNPTIQGVARTDLETAFNALASYFAAAGAGFSSKINNGTVRTNLNQILDDYFVVFGIDGTNQFLPTINGSTRNRLSLALAGIATYWKAAGAAFGPTIGGSARADLDAALTALDADVLAVESTARKRQAGKAQIFQKAITSAANAGAVTVATITTAACLIESITVKAVTAAQADLTSAAVTGGAAGVISFLNAAEAAVANLDAVDEQVSWPGSKVGAVELAATKTIVMTLVGTGATPVDLLVTIRYRGCSDGGYLA